MRGFFILVELALPCTSVIFDYIRRIQDMNAKYSLNKFITARWL